MKAKRKRQQARGAAKRARAHGIKQEQEADALRVLTLQKELAELHAENNKVKSEAMMVHLWNRRAAVALATAELAIAQFRSGK